MFLRLSLIATLAVGLAACGTDTADPAADSNVSTAGDFVESTPVPAGTYTIDTAHSRAAFRIKHLGISTVTGFFGDVTGTITVGDAGLPSLSATTTIAAASINTSEADRDDHLRSPDFFDVAQYPEITFVSREIRPTGGNGFTLVGDLTMHGVTKPVELAAEFTGAAAAPDGTQKVGFTASGEILRADWGLTWNKALETGGLLVGEEVTLDIEVEADLQAPAAAPDA